MKGTMGCPELLHTEQLKGLWIALDNCRYDPSTRQPIEGDVVDADEDLAALCERMRETGRSSCAILYCDDDVLVQSLQTVEASRSERDNLAR